MFLTWIACSGEGEPGPPPTGTVSATGHTGAEPTLPPLPDQVACATGANPMVVACSVSSSVEGPATLTLSAPAAPTRTFEDPAATSERTLYGYGLWADTTYDWAVTTAAGTTRGSVTTGPLPLELAGLEVGVSGTLFGADAVLVYVDCGWFVMIDGEGRVIWGAPTTTYNTFSDAMRWAPGERSVIAVRDATMSPDSSLVVETHVSGAELLRLFPQQFTNELTHDVDRWNGYTYLLGEQAGIGGFEVFDGTTRLGAWSLLDTFAGVEALETAHVNGLTVSEAGEVVISVFGFDSVVAVDGDPASPTFLQHRWTAAGAPGGGRDLPYPDYVVQGTAFEQQHNASRHGDDLWVFDNRSQGAARALRMAMDPTSGTLTETGSWSTGRTCYNQGGALPIEGGALVTCANTAEVFAFREGATEADWTMHASCDGPVAFAVSTRAYPVTVR
ncbi:MAG: hypothetical protein ABMA64_29290 [Myxococcota bacterium]